MNDIEMKLNNFVNTRAPSHDEIAQRAYDIYIKNGCQPDRCQLNWAQAERELRAEMNPAVDASGGAGVVKASSSRFAADISPNAKIPVGARSARKAVQDKSRSGSKRGRRSGS